MSPLGWLRMESNSKREVVDVRNLQETLAQIRTWCVMEGVPGDVLKALEPARSFPRTSFVDLSMEEALRGDAASPRPPEDIASMLLASTEAGDLVVTHGRPALGVAQACSALHRRVLVVLPVGQGKAVKAALAALSWTSMPALVEKPKAPALPPPPLTGDELIRLDPKRLAAYEEAKRLADKTPRPVFDWKCEVCGAVGPTNTTTPTLERHREVCPGPARARMLVEEPEHPKLDGAFVTRMEVELGAPAPEKVVEEHKP